MPVVFTDNSAQTLRELDAATKAALAAIGSHAVSYAKQNVASAGRVSTGNLMNSISHAVQAGACHVGTNVKYAIFNELGTGIYIGGGRKTPWSYKDNEGNWHRTRGMPGIHFIKNAVAGHIGEFRAIVLKFLKGG